MKTFEIEVVKDKNNLGNITTYSSYKTALSNAIKASLKSNIIEVVLYGYEDEERYKLDYYKQGKLSISVEN